MRRCGALIALGWLTALGSSGLAAEPVAVLTEATEREILQEANALLQEEIKLAARLQTYLVVDVHQGVILVKARGIEVHRWPVQSWQARRGRPPAGLFHLTARPPVDRPKARPGEDATEHPITLSDMPAEYELILEPSLIVTVGPPAREHPWLWLRGLLRGGWVRVASSGAWLRLVLAPEDARSLAWSLTEAMPILIGRSTLP